MVLPPRHWHGRITLTPADDSTERRARRTYLPPAPSLPTCNAPLVPSRVDTGRLCIPRGMFHFRRFSAPASSSASRGSLTTFQPSRLCPHHFALLRYRHNNLRMWRSPTTTITLSFHDIHSLYPFPVPGFAGYLRFPAGPPWLPLTAHMGALLRASHL